MKDAPLIPIEEYWRGRLGREGSRSRNGDGFTVAEAVAAFSNYLAESLALWGSENASRKGAKNSRNVSIRRDENG
jgi:hypothetical protein